MRFQKTNKLPHWEGNTTIDTGDDNTAIPSIFPIALRTQLISTLRRGGQISDRNLGITNNKTNFDIQTPYFLKLISHTPITENMDIHVDTAIIRNQNQASFSIDKAWIRYQVSEDVPVSLLAGQLEVSDVILDINTRMSIKPPLIYKQSGLGRDQVMQIDIDLEDYSLTTGISNSALENNQKDINSPGIGRSDFAFDDNNRKSIYTYFGKKIQFTKASLFWRVSEQLTPSDPLAEQLSTRNAFRYTTGVDFQGHPTNSVVWMAQFIWNKWDDFLEKQQTKQWYGGFFSIDYHATSSMSYSLLFNYSNAYDFKNTGTVFEGLSSTSVTTTLSYYFRSNVRGILEITMDFLSKEDDDDFVGHESKEDAIILGIDISY